LQLEVFSQRNFVADFIQRKLTFIPNQKARKGAAVIAASMHGFANCRKFKSPMTLTLDRVKVMSTYTVRVGLPARSST